jgi:NAD+ synthase
MKNVANDIIKWMTDYVKTNNRQGFVVGVSGGVDSALVSTLCAKTGFPTYVVKMPCETVQDQNDRGDLHINWLQDYFTNVEKITIDLTDSFRVFKNTILPCGKKFDNSLAFANSKSRLRMIALYQIATSVGGLVVGTGNKVEDFGVKFFTKYGDGGVDISPIGDLLKSEVRQMCRELHVLPELCEAIPTDGLWDDTRTDESQLGATYDELEWAMNYVAAFDGINPDYVSNSLILTPRQHQVLNTFIKWSNVGMHKMLPIPTFKR